MRSRRKLWLVALALLVALAVVAVLVAPGVDLPAMALRALIYAMVFFLLLRSFSLQAQARSRRRSPVWCAAHAPPEAALRPAPIPSCLRC